MYRMLAIVLGLAVPFMVAPSLAYELRNQHNATTRVENR